MTNLGITHDDDDQDAVDAVIEKIRAAMDLALLDLRLTPQILAAALGVIEAVDDTATLNLDDEELQDEYDQGRAVGARLPGGVDVDQRFGSYGIYVGADDGSCEIAVTVVKGDDDVWVIEPSSDKGEGAFRVTLPDGTHLFGPRRPPSGDGDAG